MTSPPTGVPRMRLHATQRPRPSLPRFPVRGSPRIPHESGAGDDAKEESEVMASGAASLAESDQSPCELVAGTNTDLGYSTSGRVYRVNDRRGQLSTGQLGTTTPRTDAPEPVDR